MDGSVPCRVDRAAGAWAVLAGIADRAPGVAAQVAADLGAASAYQDPADLLADTGVDAVVIASPATTHADLVESYRSGSSGSVFLDTDPTDTGPEFVFAGGYFVGTDYALLRTDGFANKLWGEPVEGSYRMRVDYDTDQVRMRISREALGSPDEVRVAVKVAGTRRDGSSTGPDWLGEPRSWTEWVSQ